MAICSDCINRPQAAFQLKQPRLIFFQRCSETGCPPICFGVIFIAMRMVSRCVQRPCLSNYILILQRAGTLSYAHWHFPQDPAQCGCLQICVEYGTKRKDGGCCSRKLHLLWKFGMSFLFSVITSILRKQQEKNGLRGGGVHIICSAHTTHRCFYPGRCK